MQRLVALCVVISCASAGCFVGDLTPGPPGSGAEPDAAGDPTPGDPDAAPASDCVPASAVIPDGHHNPGLACLACHDGNTAGAPVWTAAGTLYADNGGVTPLAGATVIITDAAQNEIRVVTANNGNFYTGKAIQFPIHVTASRCPDSATMQNPQQVGDCNSCHANQSRIHLP